MSTATNYIEQLQMQSHPEGGYFSESFRASASLELGEVVGRPGVERQLWTSIYFLLEAGEVSHFHRLQSDELWYFHDGGTLHIHMIHPDGTYSFGKLGKDIEKGEMPQLLVPRGTIFGASLEEDAFALVGCMVSPGFDFVDFELFEQNDLLSMYPEHEAIIKKMTR
ncbi:cupin domain-containing protein [Radiobacillus sp. PE A8.2]|uniref:cupin domain-containing protein n=1 Tax=Radiobacillus sp. PE A8.2 TaxID=3380349 RepID=UPI00388ECBB5